MPRRPIVLDLGAAVMSGSTALAERGFAPDLAETFAAGLRSGLLRDVHALLVSRHGEIVLEHYGAGADEAWGRPLGRVQFGPDVLHDLRSVSKSIIGLLYGIALGRGLVPPVDAPLLAAFADYADLATPERAGLRVIHALTMTMGTAWDETTIPYTDARNSEIAMELAPDRLRFVLAQDVVMPPGRTWTYSGGAVALLAALIARGSGRKLEDFAREALFDPLGLGLVEWAVGHDGVVSGASGARMRPRDLVRLGQLVLAGGVWQGRQVVPKAWIEASTARATQTEDGLGYGRLFYLGEALVAGRPRRWIAGFGNGGQRLWMMPEADLVVVGLSGAYNQPDSWVTPARIWREIVLANLLRL
jgi:CubicO group peptidase (beta-lactamase class C family)